MPKKISKPRPRKAMKLARDFSRIQRISARIDQNDEHFFGAIIAEVETAKMEHLVHLCQEILAYLEVKDISLFMKNLTASQVLTHLLPYSTTYYFKDIATVISNDFGTFACHPIASTVVESMLVTSMQRNLSRFPQTSQMDELTKLPLRLVFNAKTEFEASHLVFCTEFLLGAARKLQHHLTDVLTNENGVFVLCSVLYSLVGATVAHKKKGSKFVRVCDTPKEWHSIVHEFADAIMVMPTFGQFDKCKTLRTLLWCLAECLHELDARDKIAKIIDTFFGGAQSPKWRQCAWRKMFLVYLLELFQTDIESYKTLYTSLFEGRIAVLNGKRHSKSAINYLVRNCHDPTIFQAIFDEITACCDQLMTTDKPSGVAELAIVCQKRFVDKQDAYVKMLRKALHCPDEKSMFWPLLYLKKYDRQSATTGIRKGTKMSGLGARIIGQLLSYPKMFKPFMATLMELKITDLLEIFYDRLGTLVFCGFANNELFDADAQDWLLQRLTGHYVQLSRMKFSKATIKSIINSASPAWRTLIMYEVSQDLEKVKQTVQGRTFCTKIPVEAFASGLQAWQKAVQNEGAPTQANPDDEEEPSDDERPVKRMALY